MSNEEKLCRICKSEKVMSKRLICLTCRRNQQAESAKLLLEKRKKNCPICGDIFTQWRKSQINCASCNKKIPKEYKRKIRVINGYRVVYNPTHPNCMKNDSYRGWVYEHIEVASRYLGRALRDNEEVHHMNGNPSDNRNINLLVLEDWQHCKLHQWHNYKHLQVVDNIPHCKLCDRVLQEKQKFHCSYCSSLESVKKKVVWPTKEELRQLMKTKPFISIGKDFGVSDNAVRRWCRSYGIDPKEGKFSHKKQISAPVV